MLFDKNLQKDDCTSAQRYEHVVPTNILPMYNSAPESQVFFVYTGYLSSASYHDIALPIVYATDAHNNVNSL